MNIPNLDFLINQEVTQIRFDKESIYLIFEPDASIHIESDWKLLTDKNPNLQDDSLSVKKNNISKLMQLLTTKIINVTINEETLLLYFENDFRLEVIFSKNGYESVSIQPGDIILRA